jgi:hypothetical protein
VAQLIEEARTRARADAAPKRRRARPKLPADRQLSQRADTRRSRRNNAVIHAEFALTDSQ